MNKEFTAHRLNKVGFEKSVQIAREFDDLLENLLVIIGPQSGREFAIVRTKLEEACFFAKKAMAAQSQNQES